MLRSIVQWLMCLLFALATRSAWAAVEPEVVTLEEEPAADSGADHQTATTKKATKKKKKRKKKPVEEVVVEEPEDEAEEPEEKKKPSPREEVVAPGGLECSPAVTQVELRRPIPVSCGVSREGVSRIEVRYKSPGKKKFTKLVLVKSTDEWTGEIPCAATAKPGEMKLSFFARNAGDRLIAKIDKVSIELVEQTKEPPPSLPGKEPPMRCYDAAECPPEFKGTTACPGTKGAGGSAKKGWGGSCTSMAECEGGFACINGTCDQPPKCNATADCPSAGECSDGVCVFPDPDELASHLSDPKSNWIGLHFGMDLALVPEAVGVCGKESDDRKDYSCFRGGDAYEGPANRSAAGNVKSGFRMATMRIMASYERWFGRFAVGGRLGFAFGGAPKDFSPLHIEARALYSLRKTPLVKHGRPYLGIALGLAQTDPGSKLQIVDCTDAALECETAPLESDADKERLTMLGAKNLTVDAYHQGSSFFIGPTFGYIYAFTNDQGIQLNVNVMFPDIVFEPSVGYVFGI